MCEMYSTTLFILIHQTSMWGENDVSMRKHKRKVYVKTTFFFFKKKFQQRGKSIKERKIIWKKTCIQISSSSVFAFFFSVPNSLGQMIVLQISGKTALSCRTLQWEWAGDRIGHGHLWCRSHLARSTGDRRSFAGSERWGYRRGWAFTVTDFFFIHVFHGFGGNATKLSEVGRVSHDGSSVLSLSSDHAAAFGCDNERFGREGGWQFVLSFLFHQNVVAWLQITGFRVTLLICVGWHFPLALCVVATDLDRGRDWEAFDVLRGAG